MEVGHGTIEDLAERILQIKTDSTRLMIVIKDARFGSEPQMFFGPGLMSSFYVDGVSIQLENHDWLFLSATASAETLANMAGGTPRLR